MFFSDKPNSSIESSHPNSNPKATLHGVSETSSQRNFGVSNPSSQIWSRHRAPISELTSLTSKISSLPSQVSWPPPPPSSYSRSQMSLATNLVQNQKQRNPKSHTILNRSCLVLAQCKTCPNTNSDKNAKSIERLPYSLLEWV